MSPNKGGDAETGGEAEDEKMTGQGGDEKVSEGEEVQKIRRGGRNAKETKGRTRQAGEIATT